MPRLLLIDNHDSFTYNIVEDLRHLGISPTVVRNDAPEAGTTPEEQQAFCNAFDAIIISPGPGHPATPADVGLSAAAFDTERPILGICLGHQLLGLRSGATIREVAPAHGIVASIFHSSSALFSGIPQHFHAVRYHSLAITQTTAELRVTARTQDGTIMAVEHRTKPWWGVQFHPESIDSTFGRMLLANFLGLAGWQRMHATLLTDAPSPAAVAARWADQEQWAWLEFPGTTVLAQATEVLQAWQDPALVQVGQEYFSGGLAAWLEPSMLREVGDPAYHIDFQLGWIGYLGYEYRRFAEDAQPCPAPAAADLPQRPADVTLLKVEHALVWNSAGCLALSLQEHDPWVDAVAAEIANIAQQPQETTPAAALPQLQLTCRDSKASYLGSIAKLQSELARGNTYEACLTTALTGSGEVTFAHYLALRQANHSPYAAYWRSGTTQVLSASPESFLSIRGAQVSSSPIKGTRPRSADPRELAHNPKDRAENRMIVDLVRNDLAQIALPGSVQVSEHAAVYTFASVHQMISTITAQRSVETTVADILEATFPGGSMTGAPKERTMELLEQVEGQPRGVYSGALGWIGFGGDAELAMVIRTLVAHGTDLHYGVGGAVLAVSEPETEFQEIQTKSQAVRAIAVVEFPE